VSVSTVNVCVSGSVSVIATVTANALCVDSYCNLSVGTGINDAHLGELLQMMELSYPSFILSRCSMQVRGTGC
jgi:hypothetical protein